MYAKVQPSGCKEKVLQGTTSPTSSIGKNVTKLQNQLEHELVVADLHALCANHAIPWCPCKQQNRRERTRSGSDPLCCCLTKQHQIHSPLTMVHKIQRYTTSCFRNNSLKNVHLPKVCQGSKTLWGECQKQNPPGMRHCFVPHDCQSTTVSLKGWTYMLNC